MDFEVLIPITLFICVVYAIKVVVDARTRSKLIASASGGNDELVRSMIAGEAHQRRHNSLRWGFVLVALGIGFALIEAFGWREVTPGVVAVLLLATGAGHLGFYLTARRLA